MGNYPTPNPGNKRIINNLRRQGWGTSGKGATGSEGAGKTVLGVISIASIVLIVILAVNSSASRKSGAERRDAEHREKARIMRERGFQGSDRELSEGADAIKRFDEVQRQRGK